MSTGLPDAARLSRAVYSGWACVRCGASLAKGGIPAGRAVGRIGSVRMDVDVYQCRPGTGCSGHRRQPASTTEGRHHA
ncbi:hypothetical protein [Streptomyces sp. M92]|uniref:hypothetical protein n=1 Tax=Streptomyces sp. M92 TaxID=2944250 RepID=UPI00234B9248|nr:hypothetical protein [Streptomyces sp. M92]